MIDHLPWPAILGGFGDSLLELAEALCQVRGETDVMADGRFALQYIDEVDKKSGAPGVIRTPDLLVRSQTLYPAELRAQFQRNSLATSVVSASGGLYPAELQARSGYNTRRHCSSLATVSANFWVLSQIESFGIKFLNLRGLSFISGFSPCSYVV